MPSMTRVPQALTQLDSYPWRCVLPTRYGDQDPNQHINNVAIAGLFEEGRYRFGLFLGGGSPLDGVNIVAAKLTIDFLAEAHYPLDITMALGFRRLGRTSWTVIGGAFDGDRCVAVGEAVMVCVGPSGPVELPAGWRAAAEAHIISDAVFSSSRENGAPSLQGAVGH